VVLVLAVGGYAMLHKSSKTTSTSNSGSQSQVAAVNNAVLTTKTSSSVGQYLADPSGKALYTYGGDSSGVSNCKGSCLASWPAYVATGSTANLPKGVSTIKRSDNGQTQYAYNGMPLYYFVSDSQGQVTGNGVSNFSVAKPAAAASSQSTTTAPSSSSSQSTTNSSSGRAY
jgi:predicted lipoprotein with Yx(FWY)xxD motif